MIQIICDACKKAIPHPVEGITHHILLDQDLCHPCMQKLEASAEKAMGAHKAYSLKGYHDVRTSILRKMCGR